MQPQYFRSEQQSALRSLRTQRQRRGERIEVIEQTVTGQVQNSGVLALLSEGGDGGLSSDVGAHALAIEPLEGCCLLLCLRNGLQMQTASGQGVRGFTGSLGTEGGVVGSDQRHDLAGVGDRRLAQLAVEAERDDDVQGFALDQMHGRATYRGDDKGSERQGIQRAIRAEQEALCGVDLRLCGREELAIEVSGGLLIVANRLQCLSKRLDLLANRLRAYREGVDVQIIAREGEEETLFFAEGVSQEEGSGIEGLLCLPEGERLGVMQVGIAGRGEANGGIEFALLGVERLNLRVEPLRFGFVMVGIEALETQRAGEALLRKLLLLMGQVGRNIGSQGSRGALAEEFDETSGAFAFEGDEGILVLMEGDLCLEQAEERGGVLLEQERAAVGVGDALALGFNDVDGLLEARERLVKLPLLEENAAKIGEGFGCFQRIGSLLLIEGERLLAELLRVRRIALHCQNQPQIGHAARRVQRTRSLLSIDDKRLLKILLRFRQLSPVQSEYTEVIEIARHLRRARTSFLFNGERLLKIRLRIHKIALLVDSQSQAGEAGRHCR